MKAKKFNIVKPKKEISQFILYGVEELAITAAEDKFTQRRASLDVTITAPYDIEIDLLAAGLKIWGFTSDQVLAFRAVLKDAALNRKFQNLMHEAAIDEWLTKEIKKKK